MTNIAALDAFQSSGPTSVAGTKVAFKTTRAKLCGYIVHNPNASDAFIQIFNKASADVTLGTTTPDLTIKIGSGGGVAFVDRFILIDARNGITVAATTTETGNTGVGTACSVNLFYGAGTV